MIVVMNCVNLHSMYPVKWLNSPRWMGHRRCKVRPQTAGRGRIKEKLYVLLLSFLFSSVCFMNTNPFRVLLNQLINWLIDKTIKNNNFDNQYVIKTYLLSKNKHSPVPASQTWGFSAFLNLICLDFGQSVWQNPWNLSFLTIFWHFMD